MCPAEQLNDLEVADGGADDRGETGVQTRRLRGWARVAKGFAEWREMWVGGLRR